MSGAEKKKYFIVVNENTNIRFHQHFKGKHGQDWRKDAHVFFSFCAEKKRAGLVLLLMEAECILKAEEKVLLR